MKILVNKANPAIRITTPDGMVKNRTNCWAIWSEGDRLMLLDKDNWTLVEEEPEVGLENEAVAFCFDNGINITPHQATRFARHFYELGLKARKEEE